MRLWSIHPEYLDPQGLVALWRESLLAQAVLRGATKGYRQHPQLIRFRARTSPVACVAEYLRGVHAESIARGYRFDADKIADAGADAVEPINVPCGQVGFEWSHLTEKLKMRSPAWLERLAAVSTPQVHPMFRVVPGGVADWERREPPGAHPGGHAA